MFSSKTLRQELQAKEQENKVLTQELEFYRQVSMFAFEEIVFGISQGKSFFVTQMQNLFETQTSY